VLRVTARQLQKLLDGLGLSQVAAAKRIGISARQMRRYCSGEAKIPGVVECAMMWVRAGSAGSGGTES
jgi:transcriptional regulator with XRE-family HTH domain